ncbi:MAG: hypothetical protein KKA07_02300 [Bacteroidetes bacterium]|nr:hypothetical protein [Bacteroidota bacterium]MBU1717882.1 hypothetical protein [Bacteroidota bacterium]
MKKIFAILASGFLMSSVHAQTNTQGVMDVKMPGKIYVCEHSPLHLEKKSESVYRIDYEGIDLTVSKEAIKRCDMVLNTTEKKDSGYLNAPKPKCKVVWLKEIPYELMMAN